MNKSILAVPLVLSGLVGCTALGPFGDRPGYLSDQAVLQRASAGPLEATRAQIITDNDEAFASKLAMVEGARQSIDLMYYIYDDDYSSSVLTQALIGAARRGVRVRLLVDYFTNYRRLDWFSMMELQGNAGKGSLRVRFYNRPTKNIVQDAVYLTMGCGKDLAPRQPGQCSAEKFAAIDRLFAEERIDGQPVVSMANRLARAIFPTSTSAIPVFSCPVCTPSVPTSSPWRSSKARTSTWKKSVGNGRTKSLSRNGKTQETGRDLLGLQNRSRLSAPGG